MSDISADERRVFLKVLAALAADGPNRAIRTHALALLKANDAERVARKRAELAPR